MKKKGITMLVTGVVGAVYSFVSYKSYKKREKELQKELDEKLYRVRQCIFIARLTLNDEEYEKYKSDLRWALKDNPTGLKILEENLI